MVRPASDPIRAGTPPGGRRPRQSSAVRRAYVLTAARRLFAERGFHATGTRELAEAADINDALLYRYFPSKHAILSALVDEAITAFQSLPATPPASGLSPAELLEFIGNAFVRTATEQLDLLTILISEHHALIDDHRFVEFIHRSAIGLGQLLDQLAGPDADTSGYFIARSYMGSLIAFVLLQDVLGLSAVEPVDPAEYIHHLATLTARGLSAQPIPKAR
jgi:AcrR family transcriptional regulator